MEIMVVTAFMKAIQFINPLLFIFGAIACANNNHHEAVNDTPVKDSALTTNKAMPDSFEPGKVIPNIICNVDASQSYALYIPLSGNVVNLPVVYFFDPHGNGALPLNKYKTLADSYHFILIGSNNSKNGNDWSTNDNMWNILLDDSRKRLKINADLIYVCGFSGGAKVATYIGLNHPEVKAVIANGAGLADIARAGNFHFSFTAITGEGDLNMTDLVAINAELDKTQTRHRIIFFDGKHEWAPENTMNIAFDGFQLDAIQQKLIPPIEAIISNYISESKKRVTAYLKTNNYVKAEAECKLSISFLEGLIPNGSWFKQEEASLKANPVYQKQWQAKQNLLTTEQNLKDLYMQQFQKADMNYWIKTIAGVKTNAKAQTAQGAMYQRLLAYLSLATYSISNQLINGHQDKQAQYFVELYKMVDATNSEAWYFSALINARNHNSKGAEDDLLKAVENGFSDINRMIQQPEFQSPGTQINFTEIERKMKKGE
jgi:dienelactone hydrolase